jgi:hypothetical protein
MSFTDIVGTPIQIDLRFVSAGDTPPPQDHLLAGPAGVVLRSVIEAMLPQDAAAALDAALTRPLDQRFDELWANQQDAARQTIGDAIRGSASNAYDIQVQLPAKGTLGAQTGNLSQGLIDHLPPGTTGTQLTLRYDLGRIQATFKETTSGIWGSWADPAYDVSFSGVLEVAIAVPTDARVDMIAIVQFLATDFQTGADNLFAVMIGIEDAIAAWWNGHPTNPPPGDQIIGIQVAELVDLMHQMSAGFAAAAGFGFVQRGVRIDTNPPPQTTTGATVTFDLTHPFDQAPIVVDALAPGPTLFQPEIGTAAPQVNAGGQLGVTGAFFPAPRGAQLAIKWSDTTSGNVVASEVQWGPAPNGAPPTQPTDVTIPRHGRYDNANTFVATGLVPSSQYAFRVRDFDVANLIATDWSAFVVLATGATDVVELDLDWNNTVLGFAQLQPNGTFSTMVVVPANVPPGVYKITAVLGGQAMATTTITIVAAGVVLAPVLQVIDQLTGIPFQGAPRVLGGSSVLLRGLSFTPGQVSIAVDSAGGTALGATSADASGGFQTSVTWPYFIDGAHAIVASEGAQQAAAPVWGEEPPR